MGDTAELNGGQRPESVLDEGAVRAGNQGQSAVELQLSVPQEEKERQQKPGEDSERARTGNPQSGSVPQE